MQFIKKNYILLSLLGINILLKTAYLSSQPISHDEPFTIYHAQFDFLNIIHYLKNYNNPPLFELVLHFWIKVFGISPFAVRLLPMIFSSLSVIYIYKIGMLLYNQRIALVSSLLFTCSSFQIYYAHDCRVYSLFLLLTLLSFFFFFKLIKDQTLTTVHLVCFILTNTLLVYAHYFGFIVWLLQIGITLVWFLKSKQVFKTALISFTISLLLYAPQLILVISHFLDSAKNGTWLKSPNGMESIYNMFWSFCNAPVITVLIMILLAAAVIKCIITRKKTAINVYTKYILVWFIIPFVAMFLVSYKVPMFLDRYLIFITPAFYIIIALSLNFLFKSPKIYYSLSVIVIILFATTTTINPFKKRLINNTIDFIAKNKTPRTLVLVCPFDYITTFAYSYNQDYFKNINQDSEYTSLDNQLKSDHIYFVNDIDYTTDSVLQQFDTILYLDAGADFAMPNNNIKKVLSTHFTELNNRYSDNFFKIYTFKK
jgi:4-amino-4-deoxy-L-arabinose transferase-like glycosyltransferase